MICPNQKGTFDRPRFFCSLLLSSLRTCVPNVLMHTITMASTDTSTTNCASCGKEGGNLNTCNKCKMVKYCNAACKKKHRSKHKKACEKRVGELHEKNYSKSIRLMKIVQYAFFPCHMLRAKLPSNHVVVK